MILILLWALAIDPPDFRIARSIPAELTHNVDAVLRHHNQVFTHRGAGQGTMTVTRVVTVLNADGRQYADLVHHYNAFSSVRDISGTLYDADGKVLRRLRNRDIIDRKAFDSGTLMSDIRLKHGSARHTVYPYTVEWTYEVRYTGFVDFPYWNTTYGRMALEWARYEVVTQPGTPVQWAWTNGGPEPEISRDERKEQHVWTLRNRLPRDLQPLSSGALARSYLVVNSPLFRMQEAGTLDSWQAFGTWSHRLWLDRQTLPAEEIAQVRSMTATAADTREKVAIIYRYMQSQTRYVSIQLGLGGWQTETAAATSVSKYGDCKALTNYMMALLKAVGIDSHPVLINRGHDESDLFTGFAHNRFNHVILQVRLDDVETMYLECTSKTYPPGYLGSDNAARQGLLILPDGGRLVTIPDAAAEQNRQTRVIDLEVSNLGSATATVDTRYTGFQHERFRYIQHELNARDRDMAIRNQVAVPGQTITAIGLEVDPATDQARIQARFGISRFGSWAGGRLILAPNLLERPKFSTPPVENRVDPIDLGYAYEDTDTVRIRIPEGLRPDPLPEPIRLETDFGSYTVDYAFENGLFLFVRRLRIDRYRLEAERYADVRAFLTAVTTTDSRRVVFVRN